MRMDSYYLQSAWLEDSTHSFAALGMPETPALTSFEPEVVPVEVAVAVA